MNNKKNNTDISKEYIEEIYIGAKEIFCDGIYVKSDAHPCGWDFISFEDFETSDDLFEQPFGIHYINNGRYDYHEFEDKTVEDIIKKVGANGWCFEISGVDNLY